MDTVGTTHADRILVFKGPHFNRLQQHLKVGQQFIGSLHHLHGKAGVQHIGRGHALVDEAGLRANKLGNRG